MKAIVGYIDGKKQTEKKFDLPIVVLVGSKKQIQSKVKDQAAKVVGRENISYVVFEN